MALGASSRHVTQMMLRQTTRPVLYGLSDGDRRRVPARRLDPASRASRVDPMKTLR